MRSLGGSYGQSSDLVTLRSGRGRTVHRDSSRGHILPAPPMPLQQTPPPPPPMQHLHLQTQNDYRDRFLSQQRQSKHFPANERLRQSGEQKFDRQPHVQQDQPPSALSRLVVSPSSKRFRSSSGEHHEVHKGDWLQTTASKMTLPPQRQDGAVLFFNDGLQVEENGRRMPVQPKPPPPCTPPQRDAGCANGPRGAQCTSEKLRPPVERATLRMFGRDVAVQAHYPAQQPDVCIHAPERTTMHPNANGEAQGCEAEFGERQCGELDQQQVEFDEQQTMQQLEHVERLVDNLIDDDAQPMNTLDYRYDDLLESISISVLPRLAPMIVKDLIDAAGARAALCMQPNPEHQRAEMALNVLGCIVMEYFGTWLVAEDLSEASRSEVEALVPRALEALEWSTVQHSAATSRASTCVTLAMELVRHISLKLMKKTRGQRDNMERDKGNAASTAAKCAAGAAAAATAASIAHTAACAASNAALAATTCAEAAAATLKSMAALAPNETAAMQLTVPGKFALEQLQQHTAAKRPFTSPATLNGVSAMLRTPNAAATLTTHAPPVQQSSLGILGALLTAEGAATTAVAQSPSVLSSIVTSEPTISAINVDPPAVTTAIDPITIGTTVAVINEPQQDEAIARLLRHNCRAWLTAAALDEQAGLTALPLLSKRQAALQLSSDDDSVAAESDDDSLAADVMIDNRLRSLFKNMYQMRQAAQAADASEATAHAATDNDDDGEFSDTPMAITDGHESFPHSSSLVGKRIEYVLPDSNNQWRAGTVESVVDKSKKVRGRFNVKMDDAPATTVLEFPMSTIGLVWRFAGGINAFIISEADIDTPSDDDDGDGNKDANTGQTLVPPRSATFVKRKLQLLPTLRAKDSDAFELCVSENSRTKLHALNRKHGFKPPKPLVATTCRAPTAAVRSSPCSSDVSSSSVDSDDSNIRDYDAVAELRETRDMIAHLDDNDSDFEEMSKDTKGWQKV